ncbi:MAG: phytanoyl-CoA dioxygenase [Verrucomicrobia bacterium]|nr:phytanoyl-CoA dioxygenase [Verrucomicrobiota bacterium]NBU09728.1 phytanoyl-CoA dioxygenase [Pseudomonadota bacterium]NDA65989.1 phytanoyl-CoA dioxygenase [Verrucomicrobiota bacterium]NDB74968.1 phytanoyl-CoA dioxygenase [Verrucomicrobiota bacterium]NDD37585.1 phytanoyl-CoA dioxygenase [Verrucomicrobiota bacterium]
MNPTPDSPLLTSDQVEQYHRDGFLILRGFYDLKTEIEPIQRDIHQIIGIVIQKHGLPIEHPPFRPETFDAGYQPLIAHDRRLGAEIYDAVKQIPAFVRLVVNERHDRLMRQLRNTDLPGVAAGGYGIRIDNPFEEKFRANWHQDYPSQLRSIDGLVYWSSLVELTEELGPLQIAVGSHKDGLAPILTRDPENPEKTGAYALRLKDEAARIASYQKVQGLISVGDLIVVDFLNLHASGFNRGSRSRWTMQMRYFNYRDPIGQRISWVGSFAAGKSLRDVHPELIAD